MPVSINIILEMTNTSKNKPMPSSNKKKESEWNKPSTSTPETSLDTIKASS